MAKSWISRLFKDPERQRAFRLILAQLRSCRYDSEVHLYEGHNKARPVVVQWPGGGFWPDADVDPEAEKEEKEEVKEEHQKAPTVSLYPRPDAEAAVGGESHPSTTDPPLAGPVTLVLVDRHFSQGCADDVLRLLEDIEQWMTGQAILDELSARSIEWSQSTLGHTLAELVRCGQLRNRRGRGYGLPAWEE